jgi:ubiquinone/menaquinone biosynthesis C-methylase UbiE
MTATKWLIVGVLGVTAVTGGVVAWRFAFFIAPAASTGEPSRLRQVLGVKPGDRVAEIGAGNGSMAVDMARALGAAGVLYATEISPARRDDIIERSARAGTSHLRVVEAAPNSTNLPDDCCDAIYMRAVFHHIEDQTAMAASVAAAVRPGGRVAVIDFPPGALWFHGANHGVTPEAVTTAFERAGLSLSQRIDAWGGGMFLLAFDRK